MKTDLWIVFAQDGTGHVTLAGSYEVEHDPLPGLRHVLATFVHEGLGDTRFFAARVQGANEVSLHHINALPTIDEPTPSADGHSNALCDGCHIGDEGRSKHTCEGRS